MENLQQVLRTAHDETLARNEELRDAHRQDTLVQHELSLSVQSSLESLLQGDMPRISQSIAGFDTLLACIPSFPRAS